MNVILFDDPEIKISLLPLTFTRPVAEIRVGILTLSDKWAKRYGKDVSFFTEDYLREKFPLITAGHNLWINGAACPDHDLLHAIRSLHDETRLMSGSHILAAKTKHTHVTDLPELKEIAYAKPVTLIDQLWKIFKRNAEQVQADFDLITYDRTPEDISDPHTIIYGGGNLFVEKGASVKAAIINAENGPVYIGKNTEIQEGAIIKGPFALCEGAQLNLGAKIRGGSTIGPYCKVGGEVSNSILFGYSNKAHDGFIGNTVIGEWCNLGADTNTSNLKNNYANVKLWNYAKENFEETGEAFCGLIMGDHSKCSINTMFNTGTVVGVSSNIFGSGFPRNFIPSFSWGGASGLDTYRMEKVNEVAERAMTRKGMIYDETEKGILKKVFELTSQYRTWEK